MKTNTKAQSRRTFMKTIGTGALITAGASLVGLTGCSSPVAASTETGGTTNNIAWDEEYDVVVVGAGLAGLATAITVATEGSGASCLLLEKSEFAAGGGNSQYSSGSVTFTEDVPTFTQYLKDLRGDYTGTPDDILEVFAQGSSEILGWLTELGLNQNDLKFTNLDGSKLGEFPEFPTSSSYKQFSFDKEKSQSFKHISQFALSIVEQHADTITEKTSCPLRSLIQDPESNAILGATYDEKGTEVHVKANKGVVMCCGGFENDPIFKQDYLSAPYAHPVAGINNTGDGHRICMQIGADFWHMGSCAGFWNNAVSLDGQKYCAYRKIRKEQGVTVGTNGRRFYMDYDMTVSGWPGSDEVISLASDVGSRHGHQQFGGEWSLLPLPSLTWFIYDQDHAEKAYIDGTGDVVADGFAYTANTLEELASLIDVPVDDFMQTINQWNDYCGSGKDLSFFRPPSTLNPIQNGPFYAMKCCCELLNTDGGPRRNAQAQIIDVEGNPLPNLYSSGEFGSLWGHLYQGSCNLSECLVFGRIAAQNALGLA